MRKLFYTLALLFLPAVAHAQDDYPRAAYIGPMREEVGGYRGDSSTPPREECWKRPCLVIVNASRDVRITEFRLNSGEHDKHGQIAWSKNLLNNEDGVFPRNFLWWYKPEKMSCQITVKLVIREKAVHPSDMVGTFDLCGPNGPGIFVLRDPDDHSAALARRPVVTIDPSGLPAKNPAP